MLTMLVSDEDNGGATSSPTLPSRHQFLFVNSPRPLAVFRRHRLRDDLGGKCRMEREWQRGGVVPERAGADVLLHGVRVHTGARKP
jgi:hypothetical protein